MKNTVILGLLAETSIHPGSGRATGVVDLPVAREAATDYPVIVGSSLKGALRTLAGGESEPAKRLFGVQDSAGQLLVADARLVLLPVRSLTGAFRWVTCPHLIERYRRDRLRAGQSTDFQVPALTLVEDARRPALAGGREKQIFLEEREFEIGGVPPEGLVAALAELILHSETRARLPERLVVLHDDDFAWFARYGLPIQARNVLNDKTKQSENLWYEETLPPETVLYALVGARSEEASKELCAILPATAPYLQAGGNETVGQGWFAVRILGGE
ncbi:MAG TPA: type III-B CRISPR module RAMP protein Cmr4 [Nannocystaceae bacterium]|nr:type III-B CRISPR module RAMP protein Cmr4 [Nannocystaceae bacterium]